MNGEPSLSNTSKARLASGSLIAGRYEVIAELGRGGMSVVYLCVEKMLDRQVAVKLFNLLEGENYFLDRFQKEARAISALSHPNIVKVFASGIDGQHPYIVMEYLSGETLEDVLKLGPLMPDRFMSIFAVVCDAVIHAHEQQIIHRDLKPANIMLAKSGDTGSGAVKILDFSVAKILSDDPTMDKTIGLAGTPYYMSPEQCTGAPLDARSDVYSLGCLMYECITGIRPFEGDSSFKILYGHMHEPVPPFADHGHSKLYSKELKALIQKCLSKKPDDRPQHVAQVKQNLESYSTVQTSAGPLSTAPGVWKLLAIVVCFALVVIAAVTLLKSPHAQQGPASSTEPEQKRHVHSVKTIKERVKEAEQLWSEGRKEEAIKEYKQIIKRCKETKNNKGLVDAYRDCGFKLIQVGRIAEGIEMYKLRLDPQFVSEGSGLEAEYINDLAWAYNYTRDFDAAAEVCISYLKKHDSEVGMQERLANICDSIATFYITAGKNKEAIPYAKKSLLLCNEEPGARTFTVGINSTRLYYTACERANVDMTDAKMELQKTIRLVSSVVKGEHRAERLVTLGRILNQMQRFDEAIKFFKLAEESAALDAVPSKKQKLKEECATGIAEAERGAQNLAANAARRQKRKLMKSKQPTTSLKV